MNVLNVVLGYQIYVGVVEIVVFLLGAIVLGFFIHFFITSKKSYPTASTWEPPVLAESAIHDNDEWRIKYYEEVETQQKLLEKMRLDLDESRNNEEILTIEIEELQKEIKRLRENIPQPEETGAGEFAETPAKAEDYLLQLQNTHSSLQEQNQQITRMLQHIEQLKLAEQDYSDTKQENEQLRLRIQEMEILLAEKEAEIKEQRQQQQLAKEMEERLQKAYDEFNVLREKLVKLETHLSQPQNREFEYDELKQNYFKLTKEFDETRLKHLSLLEENQRISRLLSDTEDKLRESNFQRQQLHKKIGFLEELNNDLQQISEQNKKLENQLKRMSEIELLLARVAGKGEEGAGSADTDKPADKGSDY